MGTVPRRVITSKNSNLPKDVPIIGLGCSSFSHFFWSDEELKKAGGSGKWTPDTMDRNHPHVKEWIETIHYAVETCGITLLDTAPWYGHGTSEIVMGWAFEELWKRNKNMRSQLTINTKIGRYEENPNYQFDFSYKTTISSVERSLRRMNLDCIDVLQLHDPEFAPSIKDLLEGAIPAMIECQERGLCKALGITGYPLEVQHQIINASHEKFGRQVFDQALTYCHYNLHDMSLFKRPLDRDGVSSYADFASLNNINLMAAAPLSMGLLTHEDPPVWHPASNDLKEACKKAAASCESEGVNIASLAILVALSNPKICCTLLGMKNVSQVKLAAESALKFANAIAENTGDESDETYLSTVLSAKEQKALSILQDPKHGPFANVWENGTFRWDGIQDVKSFWKEVETVKVEEWQDPLK